MRNMERYIEEIAEILSEAKFDPIRCGHSATTGGWNTSNMDGYSKEEITQWLVDEYTDGIFLTQPEYEILYALKNVGELKDYLIKRGNKELLFLLKREQDGTIMKTFNFSVYEELFKSIEHGKMYCVLDLIKDNSMFSPEIFGFKIPEPNNDDVNIDNVEDSIISKDNIVWVDEEKVDDDDEK